MSDFTIFGGGAMATAVAYLLAKNRRKNVLMWVRDSEKAKSFNRTRENIEYLPGILLPNSIIATNNLSEAVSYSSKWILAVPSHAVHSLFSQIKVYLNQEQQIKVLSVIKGLDHSSGRRISELVIDFLSLPIENFAVLSGPNFAIELVENNHSVTVIASKSFETLNLFKEALESKRLIVYSSDDVIGVEISSVLKNIIAIAMGLIDGLGFGANTRGAVFTACMKEALEIGTRAFGAKPETIFGPACLGDSITTAFSSKSRNYLLGLLLAKRVSVRNLDDSFLSEGKNNIRLVKCLTMKYGIKAPITEFVYEIINGANAYFAFSNLWRSMYSIYFNGSK
jgi:glycerol-3-phosphate dehydrogenase (NAD(P)+)